MEVNHGFAGLIGLSVVDPFGIADMLRVILMQTSELVLEVSTHDAGTLGLAKLGYLGRGEFRIPEVIHL